MDKILLLIKIIEEDTDTIRNDYKNSNNISVNENGYYILKLPNSSDIQIKHTTYKKLLGISRIESQIDYNVIYINISQNSIIYKVLNPNKHSHNTMYEIQISQICISDTVSVGDHQKVKKK